MRKSGVNQQNIYHALHDKTSSTHVPRELQLRRLYFFQSIKQMNNDKKQIFADFQIMKVISKKQKRSQMNLRYQRSLLFPTQKESR